MHRDLGWWQAEDQPATTGVDAVEAEHIGQKGAVGIGIVAEQHDVGSIDHDTPPTISTPPSRDSLKASTHSAATTPAPASAWASETRWLRINQANTAANPGPAWISPEVTDASTRGWAHATRPCPAMPGPMASIVTHAHPA